MTAPRLPLLDAADARLLHALGAALPAPAAAALEPVAAALLAALRAGHACLPLEAEALTAWLEAARLRDEASDGAVPEDALPTASVTYPLQDPSAPAAAQAFLQSLASGALAPVVGAADSPAPLIAASGRLFARRDFLREQGLARELWRLARAAARPSPGRPDAALTAGLSAALRRQTETAPLRGADGSPFAFDADQAAALEALGRERVLCLTGGPGTGKTTLAAALLRLGTEGLGWQPDRVHLCAPTGRAAQRLTESLRLAWSGLSDPTAWEAALAERTAVTWQSLLGLDRRTRGRRHHAGNPLDADAVLLDEASMVPAEGFAALLEALPTGCRLLLLGDPDQLPSVESGDVLGHLVAASGLDLPMPFAHGPLRRSHRSSEPIRALAFAVREGRMPDETLLPRSESAAGVPGPAVSAHFKTETQAPPSPDEDRRAAGAEASGARRFAEAFLKQALPSDYADLLRVLAEMSRRSPASESGGGSDPDSLSARVHAPIRALLRAHEQARLITLARRGPSGCDALNRHLTQWMGEQTSASVGRRQAQRTTAHPPLSFHAFPPARPIILRAAARASELPNGAQGMLWTVDGLDWAFFPSDSAPWGLMRLPASHLPAYDTAYALTAHQSQGSEYDAVGLVLPPAGHALLARESLYTALTRARRTLRVFGSEAAWRECLERSQRRLSGLEDRLREAAFPDGKPPSPPAPPGPTG